MEQAQGVKAEGIQCNGATGHVRAFVIATLCLSTVATGVAQRSKPSEYQVKAAYLYSFSRFVEWPKQPAQVSSDHFLICVLGDDPFGGILSEIVANENVDGKTVLAQQVPTPEDATGCRVLFISHSERSHLKQILATLDRASVLTVSDLPQFTEHGGMIQFVVEDSHVRFKVNVETAKRAGLAMSSELLKLAVGVQENSAFGN